MRNLLDRLDTRLFIDGRHRPGRGSPIRVTNPATGEPLLDVHAADTDDVDDAVTAARAALSGMWGDMPGATRGIILNRVADLIERDADVFARLEATDVGKAVTSTAIVEIPNAIDTFRHFAGYADKIFGDVIPTAGYLGRPTHSYTIREPIGVIGAIVPWNGPLMISSWKLAPALAAGNTVVLKPSEEAPLSLLHLATLLHEAGLPDGVVNVVTGHGDVAGAALVAHPGVDKISFTGSPEVGRYIQRAAAEHVKHVALELGGKTPHILLPGADLDAAIPVIALGMFSLAGEVCACGSRVLVHRSQYDEVAERLAESARAQQVGDPLDQTTTMGALITAEHRDRVMGYIDKGVGEGARLLTGGHIVDGPGFFVEPTIFTDVLPSMTIAQEEIFGPVGVVIAYDTVDEAVEIANDTVYGLATCLWTRDVAEAHGVAARVHAGAVWINGWAAMDPALPWGGVKTSGLGRELGWAGILANTEEKVVTVVL